MHASRRLLAIPLTLLFFNLVFVQTALSEEQDKLIFLKQNSKPKYFDSNHEGLCGEIYAALGSQLSSKQLVVEIDPENYPIKRILKLLELGKAQVFCGAGRNEKREKLFWYSSLPVYSVANVVAAREFDDEVPFGFNDIAESGAIVGALFGTSSAAWLKTHEGVRVNDKFHSLEQALAALARGEDLRYFYYHDLGLNYLTRTMALPLKVLPTKFRTTPQWLLYSRETSEELVAELDQALAALHESGRLKAIQQRYLLGNL